MDHASHLRQIALGAMQGVVDGQKMLRGQLIFPIHLHGVATFRFNGHSRKAPTDCPHARRRKIAVHFHSRFAYRHIVDGNALLQILWIRAHSRWLRYGGNRQWVHKRLQRPGIQGRCVGGFTFRIADRETREGEAAVLQKITSCDQDSVSPC